MSGATTESLTAATGIVSSTIANSDAGTVSPNSSTSAFTALSLAPHDIKLAERENATKDTINKNVLLFIITLLGVVQNT